MMGAAPRWPRVGSCDPSLRREVPIAGLAAFLCSILVFADAGCDARGGSDGASTVTVYCSVDPGVAEPILSEFERRTGLHVSRVFDTEAGKTTGLVNRLLAERVRPRADVWWSSEIFGTEELAAAGVLASFAPDSAADIPPRFRDSDRRWTAIGLRGRVIAYDPSRVKAAEAPRRWADLTDSRYRGRLCMADPRFGTTRGHMATLLSLWGRGVMTDFYRGLRRNEVRISAGNSHAVRLLTQGAVDFAATDTDDVLVAQKRGDRVAMVYPDLDAPTKGPCLHGTLWIPCSVALVRGGPHPQTGRRLVDYLVSAEVEEKLHTSSSQNLPVRPALRVRLGIETLPIAETDYTAAAAVLDASDKMIRDVLLP